MADISGTLLLKPRPLITGDAAGLLADVDPEFAWQPTHVLETDIDGTSMAVSSSGLAASGDHWYVRVAPPSDMTNLVFYPIAFRATLLCSDTAGFDDLFELAGGFSINPPQSKSWNWDYVALDPVMVGYDGSSTFKWQNINPTWHGFPIRPATANGGSSTANALGGFQLQVKTWDATAAASCSLRIDARWLGFPQPVTRSAGFYTPRLYFNPN
jgi:hypothetical protein